MPMYLLHCESCDREWEAFFSIKADIPPCPICTKPAKRLIASKTSFHLKGTGWASEGYDTTDRETYRGHADKL